MSELAISALRQKRAELAGQVIHHQQEIARIRGELVHIDAVLRLFAQEGLWCDVASAGELHLALNAGYAPERIVVHGNAKSESELRMALEAYKIDVPAIEEKPS